MSIRLMSKVFETDLPAHEKFVLLAMADYASDTGESIYPSIETICRKTSISERMVHYSVARLLNRGVIVLVKKGGGKTSNTYRINPEAVEGCIPCTPGVHTVHPGGAPGAPDPSLNQNETREEPEYVDVSDVRKEEKQPKSKKPPTLDRSAVYALASAIAEVTGMSMFISQAQIIKEATKIGKDPRVSPELVRQIYSKGGLWYTEDWRGKKGEKPGLYDVAKTIFTFYKDDDDGIIRGGLKDRPVKERGGLK
jgi:hypothetical protein